MKINIAQEDHLFSRLRLLYYELEEKLFPSSRELSAIVGVSKAAVCRHFNLFGIISKRLRLDPSELTVAQFEGKKIFETT